LAQAFKRSFVVGCLSVSIFTSPTMQRIAFLICLACTGFGRRVQEQAQRSTASDPASALEELLLSQVPHAAFNAPGQGVYFPDSKVATTSSRAAAAPMMGAGKKAKLKEQKEALEAKLDRELSLKKKAAEDKAIQDELKADKHFQSMSLRRIAGTVDKFMYKEGVAEVLDKLDREMIGLREVKDRVRAVASMLVIDKMRMKLGLETSMPSLHMSFTGAPGTGKTTIALRMGQILQKMGYCRTGHVVMATRDDLVGQYVGHTAPKTKEMVKKAMGGILFIDEAYYLYDEENERDYGAESCEILSSVMETMQDDLIVIFAGYKELMDHFYAGQPGIKSRVGNHIDFPNYSDDELIDIGKVMLNASSMTMTPDAIVALREYMVKRRQLPFFSNARTVRNAMDMARMKGSVRTYMEIVKPMMGSTVNLPMSAFTEVSAKDIPTIEEMQGGGDGQNKVMG